MAGLNVTVTYECFTSSEAPKHQLRKITKIHGVEVATKVDVVAEFKDHSELLVFKQFLAVANDYLTRGVIQDPYGR